MISDRQGTMIGSRCQLSPEAYRRGLKGSRYLAGKLVKYAGEIVGESEDGKCWWVRWDGLRHQRLIEKVLIEVEM